MPRDPNVTRLIQAAQAGEHEALEEVRPLLYDQLERLARSLQSREGGERPGTTRIVEEAYKLLTPDQEQGIESRLEFFRVAAGVMRKVLLDAAAQAASGRRMAGEVALPLGDETAPGFTSPAEIAALDAALLELESVHPVPARIAELRIFGGLTAREIAESAERTHGEVAEDWRFARAWLVARLRPDDR